MSWETTYHEVYNEVMAALDDCECDLAESDKQKAADLLATAKAECWAEDAVDQAMAQNKARREG